MELKDMTKKYANEKGLNFEALKFDFEEKFAEQVFWNVGIDMVVGVKKVLVETDLSKNTIVVVSERSIFKFVWDKSSSSTYTDVLDIELIKTALS